MATQEEKSIEATTSTIPVSRPPIQWTVSKQKIGWRDEVTGQWWDEDGPRAGVPQNYWRQSMDEREWQTDFDVIETVLQHYSRDNAGSQMVSELKVSNKMRNPQANRLLLGSWAPLVQNGLLVAKVSTPLPTTEQRSRTTLEKSREEVEYDVPYILSMARRGGVRSLGKTSAYGTFDAHLTEGEFITATLFNGLLSEDPDAIGSCDLPILTRNDGPHAFDFDGDAVPPPLSDRGLYFGKVAYLSKYICVMSSTLDAVDDMKVVRDVWVRAEPVTSVSKDEVARIRAHSKEEATH